MIKRVDTGSKCASKFDERTFQDAFRQPCQMMREQRPNLQEAFFKFEGSHAVYDSKPFPDSLMVETFIKR